MRTKLDESGIRILLIDDEEVSRQSLGQGVEAMGFTVLHAASAEEGLQVFLEEKVDLVITEIKMPGMDGIELVGHLRQYAANIEVILMTGDAEMGLVIDSIKAGATDFLRKPIDLDELFVCLMRTRRYQEERQKVESFQLQLEVLRRSSGKLSYQDKIIGQSEAICQVCELIEKVASSERTTVLILGESGTGKELVARAIHEQGLRSEQPFVAVNCTAISEQLLESELFGHEIGAFTDARESRQGLFELADGGSLFLDEIGDMDTALQAKILRVIEERTIRRVGGNQDILVDVRIISATNQDLSHLVALGAFREDLFFRLNVFPIHLPPLRERGNDILLLTHYFLEKFNHEMGKNITTIDGATQKDLLNYRFQGNVRELSNLIERAVILEEGTHLRISGLQELFIDDDDLLNTNISLNLEESEKRLIRAALSRSEGKIAKAAYYLGISRDALRYRMKKYQIE